MFPNERQKQGGYEQDLIWGETDKDRGKGNCDQDILYEKNNVVNKRKTSETEKK